MADHDESRLRRLRLLLGDYWREVYGPALKFGLAFSGVMLLVLFIFLGD